MIAAPLDRQAIESAVPPDTRRQIASLRLYAETGSTNRELLARGAPPDGKTHVAIAEHQTAGRGRRGRLWRMPPGTGLALSAGWRFDPGGDALRALSLAVGAAVRRAIADLTGLAVGLKWPNDLIVDDRKLGGILVELDPLDGGACHAVAGVGINVAVPASDLERVSDRYAAVDLATCLGGLVVDRSLLAARVIERLVELFNRFAADGFAPYRGEWLAAHVLTDRAVELDAGGGARAGTVRGIGDDGALIIETRAGERRRIVAGDVTVRAADARD